MVKGTQPAFGVMEDGPSRETDHSNPSSNSGLEPNQGELNTLRGLMSLCSWAHNFRRDIQRIFLAPWAGLFRLLYDRRGNVRHLQIAIRLATRCLDLTPNGHPSLPHYQQRLATSFQQRYGKTGSLFDLHIAFMLRKAASGAVLPPHPDFWWHQSGLRTSYMDRFHRLGHLSDLEVAMVIAKNAIESYPRDGRVQVAWWYQCLAVAHNLRFTRLQEPQDLEGEMVASQAALDATLPSDPDLPSRQNQLGIAYSHRYRRFQRLEDLESFVKWCDAAVSGGRADDPTHIVHMGNLALAYSDRFHALGKSEDIDLSIRLSEQAAKSGALDSVQLPQCCFNLFTFYIRKLQMFGMDEDLESAQFWIQKAVDSAPSGHPDIASFQRGLALIYREKFDRFGNGGDLDSSMAWATQAVASATGGSGRHHLSICQYNLASCYKGQYQRYGDVADMESALYYYQAALSNLPLEDPSVIGIQRAMASLYRTRYHRLQEVADLEAAMSLGKTVVAATPNNHQELGARLALLASLHSDRYLKLGDREDRSAALKLYISSVESTPTGHPDLPLFQSQLAVEYSNKYAMLREEEYLEAALKYMSASVEATPPNHRQRGYRESLLAQLYAQKSDSFRAPEDREQGLLYFRNAVNTPNIEPSELWDTARKWAAFADRNQLPEVLEAYAIALRSLPELLWLGSNISTRHGSLVRYEVTSTTMQAVAACIHLRNLELAVEFLEQSLAITFQQLLDLREEFSVLEAAHPVLSTRLAGVSAELQKIAIVNSEDDGDPHIAAERTTADRQRRLATERDSILKEVRQLDSFENFLLPVPYSSLRHVSAHGPVVMINCTSKRCDILILLHPDKPIQRIPLKWSLVKDAEEKLGKLRVALGLCGIQSRDIHSDIDEFTDIGADEGLQETRYGRPMTRQRPDPKQAFEEVLAWLWATVVSPVLGSLRVNGFNDGRLWWCPTGPFTYLPLHAAGPPNDFIQSYTSTLNALLDARKNYATERKQPAVTVIALSQLAGGKASLPNVKEELLKIEAMVGRSNIVVLANDRATLANVEATLPQSTWLHLACHGQQNTKDPLKSGLLLYDTKLELGKLMTTPLPHAEFVFMSACETAMGDPEMTNESFHLAGGMLFAGFKAAIGTMWSINDQDGPPVAEAVYSHTWGQGKVPSVTDTAEALHIAVNKLRNQNVPPHRWVPFIHIGI